MNNFNENLKKIRNERKFSLDTLSVKLEEKGIKITKHGLSAYECGKSEPNIKTIVALSEIFNVTTDALLGITKEIEPLPLTSIEILGQLSKDTNGFFEKLIQSTSFSELIYDFYNYSGIKKEAIINYRTCLNIHSSRPNGHIKIDMIKPNMDRTIIHLLGEIDDI